MAAHPVAAPACELSAPSSPARLPLWGDLLSGAASGLVAFIASPPLSVSWLLPLALIPWLIRCRNATPVGWAAAGLGFGIAYIPSVPLGLLLFGIWKAAVFWLSLLAFFSLVFCAAGILARRTRDAGCLFALPAVWTVSAWVLDEWVYAPVLLSAPLALSQTRLIEIVRIVGAPGLDGLLLCVSALLAFLLTSRSHRLVALAGLAAVFGLVSMPGTVPKSTGAARVAVVQPGIGWDEYRAAGWSHLVRKSLEERLDKYTREAIGIAERTSTPYLVLWPENGNGLANMQLARRVQQLRTMLAHGRSELLIPGKEVDGERRFLSAWLVDASEIRGSVRKANLVPLIERALQPGTADVISSVQARAAVGLCYDSMFGRQFRRQLRQGASLFVVTTDDASLGSTLGEWHAAYSLLRAVEADRSLVFVSNQGPSRVFDIESKASTQLMPRGEQGVAVASVHLNERLSPATRGARHFVPAVALLVVFGLLLRSRDGRRIRFANRYRWGASLACTVVLVPLSLLAEIAGSARSGQVSVDDVLRETQARLAGPPAADSIGPLFRQTAENTCGAAASAFALYVLGDDIFEHHIVQAQPASAAEGYSLGELERIANTRGFRANGYAGNIESLSGLREDVAVIHTRSGHFLVVWKPHRGWFHVFDPAVGKVLLVPGQRIAESWTGYYQRIGLRTASEVWSTTSAQTTYRTK